MIEGVYLAVYSSVKPGCYHRFRLDDNGFSVVSSTLSIIDYINKALEYGDKARRGEIALSSVGVGQLVAKALREAYRWLGERVYPSTIIPQLVYALALGHSNAESFTEDLGKIRNSLSIILSINKWSEVKQILEALKSIRKNDMYEHVVSAGVTPLTGIEGSTSLAEVFRVLSSRWPAFTALDLSEYRMPDYVKKLLEYRKHYSNPETAITALYLDLVKHKMPEWAVKEIEDVVKTTGLDSRESFKKLLEIDGKLRRSGVVFDDYVGLLAMITALAIIDGFRI